MDEPEYAGFWIRTGAAIIDTILLTFLVWPALFAIYGEAYWSDSSMYRGTWDLLFSYVLPAVVIILFWIYKSATPGKMLTKVAIVDANTGGKPSTGQFIGRYLGYYLAAIPFGLGIIWVAFDRRKQGWHDKMAGTLVIRKR